MQAVTKSETNKALPHLQNLCQQSQQVQKDIKEVLPSLSLQCRIESLLYVCEKLLRPLPTPCSFTVFPQGSQEAQIFRFFLSQQKSYE